MIREFCKELFSWQGKNDLKPAGMTYLDAAPVPDQMRQQIP